MDRHILRADGFAATVKADGAELCSLRDPGGTEFLWQAGAAWPRYAPVLFPIVGRLADDTLLHGGRSYRLTQHGFARDRTFAWAEQTPKTCRLLLTDDDATREKYPFPFRLEVAYALAGGVLTVIFGIVNTGETPLPASIGWHPAFVWPLRPGVAKTAHTLTFDEPEPAPVRRVAGGLLVRATEPTPIRGRTLSLSEGLFAADAVILDRAASRGVRYASDAGSPALALSWHGLPQLGLWSKPGADFLCIEPWHGFASPEDFAGPFTDKPGLIHIPAHAQVTASVTVRIESAIKT